MYFCCGISAVEKLHHTILTKSRHFGGYTVTFIMEKGECQTVQYCRMSHYRQHVRTKLPTQKHNLRAQAICVNVCSLLTVIRVWQLAILKDD